MLLSLAIMSLFAVADESDAVEKRPSSTQQAQDPDRLFQLRPMPADIRRSKTAKSPREEMKLEHLPPLLPEHMRLLKELSRITRVEVLTTLPFS